jgi:GAF domain-containing protein
MSKRREGHSALRVKNGKIEKFDPHPAAALASPVTAQPEIKPHSSQIYTDLTVRCRDCGGTLVWRYLEDKDEIEIFHDCRNGESAKKRVAAPVTGPDVAQQLARKIVSDSTEGWGPEEEEWANGIAALIRTALEEQTRELQAKLVGALSHETMIRLSCKEIGVEVGDDALVNVRAEKAESETRQLRLALNNLKCEVVRWLSLARPMLVEELSVTNVKVMEHHVAEAERVLAGGKS